MSKFTLRLVNLGPSISLYNTRDQRYANYLNVTNVTNQEYGIGL